MQITASGATPEMASRTATIVSHAVIDELDRLQRDKNVDQPYWITAQQLQAPDAPVPQAAGKVRALVGMLAVGVILLFGVISVADALATIRRKDAATSPPPQPVWAPDERVVSGPGWSREQPVAPNSRWGKVSARR
jgi:hypothetical protein